MKNQRYSLLFFVFFVAFIMILPSGCAQQKQEQPGVEYNVWPGVTEMAKTDAKMGIDKTIDFFQLTYGIALKRHIKVILVADDASYKQTLIQETGASELEAERRARTSAAWSSGHTIIRNTSKTNDTLNNVFKISHEMVHQYQEQETAGAGMRIEWFTEGMADIIAAHVVDKIHLMPLRQFKVIGQTTIRKARTNPSLDQLYSSSDWNQALELYGVAVTYRNADMRVLFLVEQHGLLSLMEFLRELHKIRVPETAFQKSFMVDIKTFEQQYNDYFDSLIKKAS